MVRSICSKAIMGAAVIALVTAMSSGASAQALKRAPAGKRGFVSGRLGFPGLALLDLTEQQREQVRSVMEQHRLEMRQLGERLGEAFDGQRDAIETFPVNEGLVRSASEALAAAQMDMALLQAKVHGQIWTLLTPEQQAQAKKLQDARARRDQRTPRKRPLTR